jgi:hypothetical protein
MNSIATGSSFSRPVWTANDEILVANYGVGLAAYDATGKRIDVQLDSNSFGSASDIKSLAIARDGVRLAMVFSAGETDTLTLATISWTSVGISIVGTRKFENSISQAVDLVWSSPHSLAVLGKTKDGATSLIGLDVGTGIANENPAPVGARTIAVGAKATIYVGVTDGNSAAVVKQLFGPWVKVSVGAAPFTVIE